MADQAKQDWRDAVIALLDQEFVGERPNYFRDDGRPVEDLSHDDFYHLSLALLHLATELPSLQLTRDELEELRVSVWRAHELFAEGYMLYKGGDATQADLGDEIDAVIELYAQVRQPLVRLDEMLEVDSDSA